jgi:hypothetical protein
MAGIEEGNKQRTFIDKSQPSPRDGMTLDDIKHLQNQWKQAGKYNI